MNIRIALIAAAACAIAAPAFAQPPAAGPAAPAAAAPAKAKYSSTTTPLAELMKNPATKAVLAKHLTGIFSQIEDNIDMIPPDFTLAALADYAQGAVTPEAIKAIDADLAKL